MKHGKKTTINDEIARLRRELADCDFAYNYMKERNVVLTEALLPFATAAATLGLPRAKVDPNDFWVSIGVAGSKWRRAVEVLKK